MSDKHSVSHLLMAVLMILLLPLRWIGAALIAALIHELGHYISVRLLGGTVHHLGLSTSGAVMEASGLDRKAELICLLAGPLTGLLPLLMFRHFPVIAVCGLIQSIYNLLPLYPLDGGRILKLIIFMTSGTDRCFQIIEKIVSLLLILLCIFIHLRFGISLFIFVPILIFRKTPCKQKKYWI